MSAREGFWGRGGQEESAASWRVSPDTEPALAYSISRPGHVVPVWLPPPQGPHRPATVPLCPLRKRAWKISSCSRPFRHCAPLRPAPKFQANPLPSYQCLGQPAGHANSCPKQPCGPPAGSVKMPDHQSSALAPTAGPQSLKTQNTSICMGTWLLGHDDPAPNKGGSQVSQSPASVPLGDPQRPKLSRLSSLTSSFTPNASLARWSQ